MARFDHKVHHTDQKGRLLKTTPYSKVVRLGVPELYFDHTKKRFFYPGSMEQEVSLNHIPEDVFKRYMGFDKASYKPAKPEVPAVQAAAPVEEEAEEPVALVDMTPQEVEVEKPAKARRGRPRNKRRSEGGNDG